MRTDSWHPFERALAVTAVSSTAVSPFSPLAWTDFWLNPRRLRGSDFLMRWSQGVWSEDQMRGAVLDQGDFHAMPYGPSGVAPSSSVREFELYFERLEAAGLGGVKRPDLLIFRAADVPKVLTCLHTLGGTETLPFTAETEPTMRALLDLAVVAIECENSLWRARQMPAFGTPLRPQARLAGQLGLPKSAVLPTIIVKDEDLPGLRAWSASTGVPIHVWHSFFDLAYGIALEAIDDMIASGRIQGTKQVFQAPGGATSTKVIYKVYYHFGYSLAESTSEPELRAEAITDKNGHIMPYVRFEGGGLRMLPSAVAVLHSAALARKR